MEKITKSSDKVLIDPNEPLILPDGTALVGRVEWFLYALCCLDYQNLPTPMSRIEEFANALITGEIPNIQPQSRAEQFFLAILDGNISDLPQPQSRSEVLLDKLARGEFDLSDVEPIQSSYELLLAYLIKNGGIGNIDYVLYEFSEAMKTMYNTVEKPFKSLELSGNTLVNCVLEDTENDDYVSFDQDYEGQSFTINGTSEGAIKSAILSGNTLVNIANYSDATVNKSSKYIQIGSLVYSVIGKPITLFNFTDKVITFQLIANGSFKQSVSINANSKTVITLSDGEEIKNIRGTQANGWIIDETSLNELKLGLMVIEGDYINIDIPYFEGMQSVKMPVLTTIGKNLFDLDKYPFKNDRAYVDGQHQKWGAYKGIEEYFPVKPNTTYTFSNSLGKRMAYGLVYYDANYNVLDYYNQAISTFTTPNSCKYIRFSIQSETLPTWVQIEQGSTTTPYEPYKSNILTVNEPIELRGIGDVQDTLDCLTGEKIERIGEIVLDGTEEWNVSGHSNWTSCYTKKYILPHLINKGTSLISDKMLSYIHYDHLGLNDVIGIAITKEGYICFKYLPNGSKPQPSEVSDYLKSNPITIQYPLETESIKTVALNVVDQNNTKIDKMHVFNEVTHVNASSDELIPMVNISKSASYPTIIKPNTKYTVDLKRNDKPLTVNLGGTEVTFTDGETRKTITTPSTLTNDKLSYYGIGAKCNEIMLIEGEIERNIDYFTGMQSVVMQNQMPILHTVGKNLLNDSTSVSGWISDSGAITVRGELGVGDNYLSDYIYTGDIQHIKSNTGVWVWKFDENKNFISLYSNGTVDIDVSDCAYIRIGRSCGANNAVNLIGTMQLESGTQSTSYEPYKTSILSCNEDVTLRGIGDVKDTLDCLTGELTQRIGEVILNGETTANGYTSVDGYIGEYAIHISQLVDGKNEKLYFQGLVGNIGNSKDYILTNGFLQYKGFFTPGNNYSELEEGLYRYTGANHAYICISASRFTEHTFEGIKKFLSENPQSYLVTNKESVVKTVDLSVVDQDGNAIPKIKSYKDVTHLEITVPKQSLLPHISAEVATDNSKDMSSLTTKHQEISEAQSTIQDSIQSQLDEIDTALMATTEIFESILE